jgi:hypothetical protein
MLLYNLFNIQLGIRGSFCTETKGHHLVILIVIITGYENTCGFASKCSQGRMQVIKRCIRLPAFAFSAVPFEQKERSSVDTYSDYHGL